MAVAVLLFTASTADHDCCRRPVWAFAVTACEILTRDIPFPLLDPVSAATQVTHGLRVDFPRETSPELLALMQSCMEAEPADRPSFEELVERLSSLPSVFADRDLDVESGDSSSLSSNYSTAD
jgi:serine/threonine protein kinase